MRVECKKVEEGAKQSHLSILLARHMVAVSHRGAGGRWDADEMLSYASQCRQMLQADAAAAAALAADQTAEPREWAS